MQCPNGLWTLLKQRFQSKNHLRNPSHCEDPWVLRVIISSWQHIVKPSSLPMSLNLCWNFSLEYGWIGFSKFQLGRDIIRWIHEVYEAMTSYLRTTLSPTWISFPASRTTSGVKKLSVPTWSFLPSLSNTPCNILVKAHSYVFLLQDVQDAYPSTAFRCAFNWRQAIKVE